MYSDIVDLCERLKLTEGEQQEVEIHEEDVRWTLEKSKKCIMACVLADKEINRNAFRNTLIKVWQIEGKADITDMRRNKFLIAFTYYVDKNRVMHGRPWTFDKFLICLVDYEDVAFPKEMQFTKEPFWIQCHDLPFACMNYGTGERLGNSVGQVLRVETSGGGSSWGKFTRFKIFHDITKPLARGRFLTLGVLHEKLPNFCYTCGIINHMAGNYRKLEWESSRTNSLSPQYGAWLRA
ncbi:hypothetical protein F2P56_007845 [Juglans regia]|uniref:Uncharacterized protein LOC109010010 n=2 Tax=Juglans regia TaxID=51240 RepID=A0A2I4GQR7_JUGRE|nr:uncharacterized protein LOC109010010 [Juglans regia]KAF5476106.1 hypothetical protein F2P56_007845 [Juglans regia]